MWLITGTQDGGTVITRTIMMGGPEPTRTETIRQTTMPTEVIQKTITIEGDGNQLTAEELRDIISKHAGDLDSSEVVTTVRHNTVIQKLDALVHNSLFFMLVPAVAPKACFYTKNESSLLQSVTLMGTGKFFSTCHLNRKFLLRSAYCSEFVFSACPLLLFC